MIIVLIVNPNAPGQLTFEGCDLPTARNVMASMVAQIDAEAAKPKLIVPNTVIPLPIKESRRDTR
jgi:hypothetical protein